MVIWYNLNRELPVKLINTNLALYTICKSKTTKKQAIHQDFSECVCVCPCGCFEESGADKSSDTLRSCSFGEDLAMYSSKCRSSLSTTKFGFSFSRRFATLDLLPAFGKSFMRTYFKFLKYKTRKCSYLLVQNDLLMVSSLWQPSSEPLVCVAYAYCL